ncbi:cyclic nucleotide-binding domain-containing protein [Nodosilinea sp. P-1105]|uniref:Crp/Fnr family transcriptional regulator n=1 Tax=Nodosilinea sp. P-1105 TaxID=2546229 RepID=UPI00146B9DC4|nr:cyclic nucleotide-binding domain-containing protein [Nodosilinea sp. P-1105]NMF86454.1 cyclic nucleotide-binding domain-containing protein [Nodosilinea sp. P-1105]
MLTSVDRLLFIRNVPIFKELRDDFLVRLASVMDEVLFEANYTIITEGQEGRSMYIVVSGQVSVHIQGQQVAQLKQDDCFGEMSVFDAEPRSASVTTITPCECLVLTQQQLYDAIDETPGIAVNIIRLLSRRIRELNQDINAPKQSAKLSAKVLPAHAALGLSALKQENRPTGPSPDQFVEPTATEESAQGTLEWDATLPYGNVTY